MAASDHGRARALAMDVGHTPVMLRESLGLLAVRPGGCFVDATFGRGGHTLAIAEAVGPEGHVIALDCDHDAVAYGRRHIAPRYPNVEVLHGNFAVLDRIVKQTGRTRVDGVLLDLGVSSPQLAPTSGRGFSFSGDEPLDMRMDQSQGTTAAEALRSLPERDLAAVLRRYGDERHARRIARAIAVARAQKPILTTRQLAEIVRNAVPESHHGPTDPATRTFMALRIYVNNELQNLASGLLAAFRVTRISGRVVVLAYHSGEDRIVKQTFAGAQRGCICSPDAPICSCGRSPWGRVLTRRPIRPSEAEIAGNPRARSCRLRGALKIQEVPGNGR